MYHQYSYADLMHEGYTGTAWNVVYEFSDGFETWGASGEFADELDAWFKDRDEAIDFADECYDDDYLISMLENAPEEGGATSITLSITDHEWEDGAISFEGGEDLFVTYMREDGNIVLEESFR